MKLFSLLFVCFILVASSCDAMDDFYEDLSGEKSCADCREVEDTAVADDDSTDIGPRAGNDGIITADTVLSTSIEINWTAGNHDTDAQADLEYFVVQSTEDNISTIDDAKDVDTSGRTMVMDWTANTTTLTISSLTPLSDYYYNVIVRDTAQNETIYSRVAAATIDQKLFLFSISNNNDGDLGGRSGADSLCQTDIDNCTDCDCSTTVAFISIDSADEIADYPTAYTDMPTNLQIVGPTSTVIADDWAALLDSDTTPLQSSMADAGVTSGDWWSGSFSDGTGDTDPCMGFTNTGTMGKAGTSGATDGSWLDNADENCTEERDVLCLCY